MALKTFNLTANGTSAPQTLDTTSLACIVTGPTVGGTLSLEASANGTNFAPIFESATSTHPGLRTNRVNNLTLPAGWSVRARLSGAGAGANVTITIQ